MNDTLRIPLPDQKRSKTDLFCLFLFGILFFAMFGLAIRGWTSASYHEMLTVKDSVGNKCGIDIQQFPYLYFVSPHSESLWKTVCVKQCPHSAVSKLECYPNNYSGCTPINSANSDQAVQIYESQDFMSFCIPKSEKIRFQISPAISSTATVGKIMLLHKIWPVLVSSILVSIIASMIIYVLMRYLACYIIYLFAFFIVTIALSLGLYLITDSEPLTIGSIKLDQAPKMIIGATFLMLSAIIMLVLICFRHRFNLYASISELTSRFVNQNCLLSLFSFVILVLMIVAFLFFLAQALSFYSFGLQNYQDGSEKQFFAVNNWILVLFPLFFILSIWTLTFLKQIQTFIVAGTATNWYFGIQKPFSLAIKRLYRYHLGSVLAGSLLYALFGALKLIYQIFKTENSESKSLMGYCRSCCSCLCCLCTYYIFNLFNSGAYTYIHLHGQGYCSSASDYVSLLMKHPMSTFAMNVIKNLFSIVTNLGILTLAVVSSYIFFSKSDLEEQQASFRVGMVLVVGISLLIGSLFSSIYSESMQAILICFLTESVMDGVLPETPRQLKSILELSRKEHHIVE